MSKLFYDCPIEAAYMAKNFGVAFSTEGLKDEHSIIDYRIVAYSTFLGDKIELNVPCRVHRKFYIHPDSLPIFEPQVGDVLMLEYATDLVTACEPAYYTDKGVFSSLHDNFLTPKGEVFSAVKIIQRNNRAFIMPKEEA